MSTSELKSRGWLRKVTPIIFIKIEKGQQVANNVDTIMSATKMENKIYKLKKYNKAIANPIYDWQ